MRQVKKNPIKLRQNRGATIVLALLLLAICTVLGASALAAASASATTASRRQERQAAYLSVRSAANLLGDKAALPFEKTVTSVVSDDAAEAKSDVTVYADAPAGDVVGATLIALARKIDAGSVTATKTLTITGTDMPEVTAVLVMDSDYILRAVLTSGGDTTYTMTLILSPDKITSQTETEQYTAAGVLITSTVRETVIRWSVTTMTKGAES